MARYLHFLIVMFTVFGLVACSNHTVQGNGNFETQTRDVSTFDQIAIMGQYRVIVQNGAGKQQAQVVTDANLQPLVMTRVRDNILYIKILHGYRLSSTKPVVINVFTQGVKALYLAGQNDVTVRDLSQDSFAVNMNGENTVTLMGTTKKFKIHMAGASELNAQQLKAHDTEVEIFGAGMARVWATESLLARIAGSGEVDYLGSPKTIKQSILGAGKVIEQKSID